MVERRAYPCTKIGILLKSRKNCMLVPVYCCFGVPVPVYLVSVPLPHCMWVPVPLCVVPVPLPLQMLPLTVALLGASRQRLPSTAMIYICSLDTNPYKKCAWNSKNLHRHKIRETIKVTYSYTKWEQNMI